jgi:phytoene dehydrogenase-like protein
VHNTGYPEAQRVLDHGALDLRPFVAGALVRVGDRLRRVGDPRSVPAWAPSTLTAPIGSLRDKALVGATAAYAGLAPVDRLLRAPETTTREALRARGLSDRVVERFYRPFLSGVFLEDALDTSSRFFDLVWRSFARGSQCVPAGGMGAIPAQLAGRLPAGVLHLDSPVERLPPARAVVVATAALAAARLLPGCRSRR